MLSTQMNINFRCSQSKSERIFDAVNPNQNTFSMLSTQIGMSFRCCQAISKWFFDAVNPCGPGKSMYPLFFGASHNYFRCRTGKNLDLKPVSMLRPATAALKIHPLKFSVNVDGCKWEHSLHWFFFWKVDFVSMRRPGFAALKRLIVRTWV